MSHLYGVYYYNTTFSSYSPNVKVIYFSSDINKVKKFTTNHFYNIRNNINNTYNAIHINTTCIMWISSFEMDKEIKDIGLGCNQPLNPVDILYNEYQG